MEVDGVTRLLMESNRPAEPCGAGGAAGSFAGRTNGPGLDFGRGQPLGLATGLLGAKDSFQPLGVNCQISLLG